MNDALTGLGEGLGATAARNNVPTPTPEIAIIIGRVSDTISRIIQMRERIAQRNDKLFGCIPSLASKNDDEEKPSGAISELKSLIEILHQNISILESEIDRQEPLV